MGDFPQSSTLAIIHFIPKPELPLKFGSKTMYP